MVRKTVACLLICSIWLCFQGCGKKTGQDLPTVGIFQFGPDPAIDAARRGVIQAFEDAGYTDGENINLRYTDAQSDWGNINVILQKYVSDKVDLIIPLTTPCLVAAINGAREIPVVFTAVYDPYRAGAGTDSLHHLPNVTGVGSYPPVIQTIDFIKEVLPQVKRIGSIWNSSEANSASAMEKARNRCGELGVELVERTVTNTSEIYEAALSVAQKRVDAFFVTGDNTVLASFDALVKVTEEHSIPLFINDPDILARGATVAYGFDFYEAGYAGGKLAVRVLRGEDPATIPIQEVMVPRMSFNRKRIEALGLKFPKHVWDRADEVVE